MYENYTYENLMDEVLERAPEELDTREGSIFFDSVSGIILKIAELYTELEDLVENTLVMSATGEALDKKASEHGVTRLQATPARYYVELVGTMPELGERFYVDGVYFFLGYNPTDGVYFLEAEEAGTAGNNIYAGENAVPVNTIDGLESSTFGLIYEYGTDEEEDDDLRDRVQEKIGGPAENGNKQHYKTWCEEIDGVGVARIYPLWNGPNTVKAVLIDGNGLPCSSAKVAEIQEIIDPNTKGTTILKDGITYNVGDGLGEGKANLGAHFTAVGAFPLKVNVSFRAELASGATIDAVIDEAEAQLKRYFSGLVLDTEKADDIVIRISAIGAMLSGMESILDYSNLTINGGTVNIKPGEDFVPITGEVIVL